VRRGTADAASYRSPPRLRTTTAVFNVQGIKEGFPRMKNCIFCSLIFICIYYILFPYLFELSSGGRLCGLVNRDPEVPVSIRGEPDFLRLRLSGTGSTQPREDN
jgi:hypothetical protein